MPPAQTRPFTLRRSCQACVKGKRRCDQRSPKCSRCFSRGFDCEYANAPMTITNTPQKPQIKRKHPDYFQGSMIFTSPDKIESPLRLEIAKEYEQSTIRFLVNGIRELPSSFAKDQKTLFVHPDINASHSPAPIRDITWICKLHVQAERANRSRDLNPLLRRKLTEYTRHLSKALEIEELLGYSQAIVLTQCILALSDGNEYSEATSIMLEWVARRLWQQAPTQLPSSLSPRYAWLLAESIRRTIIVSLMLRSAYSLHTRDCSVRTPFVDALPFDMRTDLWETNSEQAWSDLYSESNDAMVSLHEYSGSLERGEVYGIDPFSALILAACKGKEVSAITTPPASSYIKT